MRWSPHTILDLSAKMKNLSVILRRMGRHRRVSWNLAVLTLLFTVTAGEVSFFLHCAQFGVFGELSAPVRRVWS